MNLTLIIFFALIVLMAWKGFKKGATKELTNLISWTVTLFVMSLVIMLYTSLTSKETRNSVYTIIILIAVSIVYGVVKIFLKSVKILSKLPVIKFLDQMVGFLLGAAEGVLLVFLLYILNESGLLGNFGEMIRTDTAKSEILSIIYEYNYLIKIAKGF